MDINAYVAKLLEKCERKFLLRVDTWVLPAAVFMYLTAVMHFAKKDALARKDELEQSQSFKWKWGAVALVGPVAAYFFVSYTLRKMVCDIVAGKK